MSHMMSCKLLSGLLGVLMDSYISVVFSSRLRLLMNSFFDLFIDRFYRSCVGSLDGLVVCFLCLFMMRGSNSRDKLMLLFL